MKKAILIVLILSVALGSLVGCGKDDFISANIQLAFYKNTWYWRSEIIEEEIKGCPEYVYKLPKTLNDKINKIVG